MMEPMAPTSTATRETILERAVQLASTDGLEGLTIGRLASETGMSKSGVFGHFGSKEELQLATVGEASRRFVLEVLGPVLSEPEGAPRLRAYFDRYLVYLRSGAFPGGCFWAASSAEFDDRPGPVRDAIRDAIGAWLAALEHEAAAAGADDPAQLAFELHSIALGANMRWRLFGDETAFARVGMALDRLLPEV